MLKASGITVRRARTLRSDMSLPEVLLWRELRKRPAGLKFRRQHPAGPYILDFFCASAGLAIEVDGEAHNRGEPPAKDASRDAWLALHHICTLRIPASAILTDLSAVIDHIVATLSPDRLLSIAEGNEGHAP